MSEIIRIETFTDDRFTVDLIMNEVLDAGLAVTSHIVKTESNYIWNGGKVNNIEYCLSFDAPFNNLDAIVSIIKNRHNYELPVVNYYEIASSEKSLRWMLGI